MASSGPIPTAIRASVGPADLSPQQVGREFRRLIDDGALLSADGLARRRPGRLLSAGYTPKYRLDLFSTRYYLTKPRQNPDLRFFVAYIVQGEGPKLRIAARIFYKDISLVWRAASHIVYSRSELWIGKGDVGTTVIDGVEMEHSMESTTDLPLEIQATLEMLNQRDRKARNDEVALKWILRRAPSDRIAPYHDFSGPRKRAARCPANLIHRGKSIAAFRRKDVPESLHVVRGFEPDFSAGGILERSAFHSSLYGGDVQRFRILSANRKIQYGFLAAPRHIWIAPPQALTTELSSFGVRTIDVAVDEDLCIPGYEYHFLDTDVDPPALHSQIPEGFVGAVHPHDEDRADASAWNHRIPMIRAFRDAVLGRRV